MKSIIIICGNLGRDSELKFTPDGLAILKFSVAGETGFGKSKATTWWNCALFGKRAESLADHLNKGSKVLVTGEPSIRTYTNKEGVEKFSAEINVKEVSLVGSKPATQVEPEQAEVEPGDTSDVPF